MDSASKPNSSYIETIESLPVIGEEYLVRSVRTQYIGEDFWWPIMGNKHEDREWLGIDWYHYHHDLRFMTDKMIVHSVGFEKNAIPVEPIEIIISEAFRYVTPIKKCLGEPVYKPWKCVRQMPMYPVYTKLHLGAIDVYDDITERIEKPLIARGAQMKINKCLRCPHRGLPLNGIPEHHSGMLVCPGHGLKLDKANGTIVSRSAEREMSKNLSV